MTDIREQVAKRLEVRFGHWYQDNIDVMEKMREEADQILSIPLPTIDIECSECGGKGFIKPCGRDCQRASVSTLGLHCSLHGQCDRPTPCTCTNGEREYRIVWERERAFTKYPDGSDMTVPCTKPLTQFDLIDPDVADAYVRLRRTRDGVSGWTIENNKGTLCLREVTRDESFRQS